MGTHHDETDNLEQFTAWLAQLRVDLAESVGGVMLRGARVVQIGTPDGNGFATARPLLGAGSLVGYAIRNASATDPASVVLRDGRDGDGDLVVPLELAAGESARDWFGPGGLNLSAGLFVDVVAGVVDGAVYLRGSD